MPTDRVKDACLVGHRLENRNIVTWHISGPFHVYVSENPTTPPSVLQVYPASTNFMFPFVFPPKSAQRTVQQHLLKQRNTICKILQSFSLLVQLGTGGTFQDELFDLQHTGM